MNQEVMEINLIDLVLYICSKYRTIIVVAIIMGLLGGGYGYYSQSKADAIDKDTKVELALDEIKLTLDEEHLKDVYYSYETVYEAQKEKNMANPAMKADPKGVYYSDVTYAIKGNEASLAIAQAFILKTVYNEENYGALYEMDSVSVINNGNNDYADIQMDKERTVLLKYTVYGVDEQECMDKVALTKLNVDENALVIKERMGKFDYILINDTLVNAKKEELLNYQNGELSKEYQAYSALNGVKNAMPADVKEYITTKQDFEKNDEEHSAIMSAIKYFIIGIVAGSILIVCIYVVGYIFNKKLRFEDDFESIYGLNILGRCSGVSSFKGLDKKISDMRRSNIHIFSEDEVVDMIVAGIKVKCDKADIKKVYVTGSCMSDKEKVLMDKVVAKLKGVELIIGKPMQYYADALEATVEIGNVVLVEKARESGYAEIAKAIKLCTDQDVNILGAVIVE